MASHKKDVTFGKETGDHNIKARVTVGSLSSYRSQESSDRSQNSLHSHRKIRASFWAPSLHHRHKQRSKHNENKPPPLRFLPTYRLDSQYPFHTEYVQEILKSQIVKTFRDYKFNFKTMSRKCDKCALQILNRVKGLSFDRYRLICTVTGGEKYFQGATCGTSFLWDAERDKWTSYFHETPDFYVCATVYGVYFD